MPNTVKEIIDTEFPDIVVVNSERGSFCAIQLHMIAIDEHQVVKFSKEVQSSYDEAYGMTLAHELGHILGDHTSEKKYSDYFMELDAWDWAKEVYRSYDIPIPDSFEALREHCLKSYRNKAVLERK